jgi:hypothetical protein
MKDKFQTDLNLPLFTSFLALEHKIRDYRNNRYRNLTHNNKVEISTSLSIAVTPKQSSECPWRCTRPDFIARYQDVYLFAGSMEVATLDSFFSHLISSEVFKEIEPGLYELLPIK